MRLPWPNVVLALRPYLEGILEHNVGSRVPARVETALPFTRIRRGPGSDDGITDSPLVDIETFAATEGEAWELAETTRQAMLDLPGRQVTDALVDTVETATGPVDVDYGNPAVVRIVTSYRVAFRRTHH